MRLRSLRIQLIVDMSPEDAEEVRRMLEQEDVYSVSDRVAPPELLRELVAHNLKALRRDDDAG